MSHETANWKPFNRGRDSIGASPIQNHDKTIFHSKAKRLHRNTQDEYWKHMVKKWPDLERGESATETGRTHIPPRLFKEAAHLQHQQERLTQLLSEVTPLNAKKKTAEIEALIDQYIPGVEKLRTQLNKFSGAYRELKAENARLEKQLDAGKEGIVERLRTAEKLRELDELRRVVDNIPPEILRCYGTTSKHKGRGQSAERGL